MKKNELNKAIGKRIQGVRMSRGMNQGELAKRTRISRPQICNLEAGRSTVTIWTLARIAAATGYTMAEILDPSVVLPDIETPRGRPVKS